MLENLLLKRRGRAVFAFCFSREDKFRWRNALCQTLTIAETNRAKLETKDDTYRYKLLLSPRVEKGIKIAAQTMSRSVDHLRRIKKTIRTRSGRL